MIRTMQGYRAHQIEGIIAEEAGIFVGRDLFVLEGVAGIYRKIKPRAVIEGSVWVFFQSGLIQVVRVKELDAELREAGFTQGSIGNDPNALFVGEKLENLESFSVSERQVPEADADGSVEFQGKDPGRDYGAAQDGPEEVGAEPGDGPVL